MRSRRPIGRLLLAFAAAIPAVGLVGCGSGSSSTAAVGPPAMASGRTDASDPATRPPTNIPGVDRTTTALAGVRALRDELTEDKSETDAVLAALGEVAQGQ